MDINYKLFKEVFDNKYLLKKIFKFVKVINKEKQGSNCLTIQKTKLFDFNGLPISTTLLDFNEFITPINRRGYGEATLSWMLTTKNYELLKDKIKINFQWDEYEISNYSILRELIITLHTIIEDGDQLLEKFYKSNSSKLKTYNYSDKGTYFKSFGVFPFSILTQNPYFVKLIINDYLSSSSSSSTTQNNNNNIDIEKDLKDFFKISLKLGNLEIIKLLFNSFQLKFNDDDYDKLLYYSLLSDNRDNVVTFLLDEIGYKSNDPLFPQSSTRSIFVEFNIYIMKLEFNIFKKLISSNNHLVKSLKINDQPFQEFISLLLNEISPKSLKKSNEISPFNQFLNYFKSLVFVGIINNNNNLSNNISTTIFELIFKKINKLIEYNNNNYNNNNNNINNNKEKEISKDYTNSNNLIKKFISKFSSHEKLLEINFNNFDSEREIKRIFIFDFLKRINGFENDMDWQYRIVCLIIQFYSEYKEYDKIKKEFFNNKNELLLNNYKLTNHSLFRIILNCSKINYDSVLFEMVNQLFPGFDDESLLDLDDEFDYNLPLNCFKEFSIKQKLNFLSTLYNINSGFSTEKERIQVLKSVIQDLDLNVTIEFMNELGTFIKNNNQNYFLNGGIKKQLNSMLLINNSNLFKYFFNNFNNLFTDWGSKQVYSNFIEKGNLELVKFCFDNIGCKGINSYINYSKSLKTAKYLYEELGFKFNNQSLQKFSETNDWDLINYTFNKIIITNNLIQKAPIQLIISNNLERNYKFDKFLESKILNGILKPDQIEFICPNHNDPLSIPRGKSYFNYIYDINSVFSTLSIDDIKRFLKDYQLYPQRTVYDCQYSLVTNNETNQFLKSFSDYKMNCNKINSNGKIYINIDFILEFIRLNIKKIK
ncbi:hypothetical protein ACTFIR_005495 [Dictyostelium discoideum]